MGCIVLELLLFIRIVSWICLSFFARIKDLKICQYCAVVIDTRSSCCRSSTHLVPQDGLNKHQLANSYSARFFFLSHPLRLESKSCTHMCVEEWVCTCMLIWICTADFLQEDGVHICVCFSTSTSVHVHQVCVAMLCACVSIIAPSPTAAPGCWQLDNSFLLFQGRAPERTNMIINHYSNRKVRRSAQDCKRAL